MFKGKYNTASSHRQMIQDSYRTFSYKDAIESSVKKNDVVIDYGSGSGILSIMAARSGAKKVYAIERNPETLQLLKHNIHINNLDSIIEIFEGDAEQFVSHYSNIQIDVVISECIGDHLFENKMVYEFLYLDDFYKPRCKIPYSMELCYYPGKIKLKDKVFQENIKILEKNNIKIELEKVLPEIALDVGFFEEYDDSADPYFNLIDSVAHKDCTSVFYLESLQDLKKYLYNEKIIKNTIDIKTESDFLLFYFHSYLSPTISFHNHPSRPKRQIHSYYQRLIPNTYADRINVYLDFIYDKIANEDTACQNIRIENDV